MNSLEELRERKKRYQEIFRDPEWDDFAHGIAQGHIEELTTWITEKEKQARLDRVQEEG